MRAALPSDWPRRLLTAGLLTAIVDGLFSSVLSAFFYGSTVARLWQGVASTAIGPSAMEGGAGTVALGLAMHAGVAFAWSALFLFVVSRLAPVRRTLATRAGIMRVAAVYGPFVWLVMSLLVIPALVQRPPSITFRWWVQLAGHFPFVGLPIVWAITRSRRRLS